MGYKVNGVDVLAGLTDKSTFFDIYPSLSNVIISPALWTWGNNNAGQLGNNSTVINSSPIQTLIGGTIWKQVACGYSHTAAIQTNNSLWVWGNNVNGQLGDNTRTNRLVPSQIVGTTWKQISCGGQHTSAVKTDGTLWSWGYNVYGQMGDNTRTHRSSPVQTIAAGTTWKQVSCGSYFTAAIKTDGTLWLWGQNNQGPLGDNSIVDKSSPVQTVAGGTNWKQVSSGNLHTAAIKTDGTLWTWGNNNAGNLGNNSSTNISSPIQTVAGGTNWKQVSASFWYSTAIKTDGTLWAWGNNTWGQLGDNTTANKSSPIQTIAGGTNWKQVSCGYSYTISAIKTDGTLWLWGNNSYGQLGNNTRIHKSSPVQTIATSSNWKQVSVGSVHTAAIAEDDPFL